MWIYLNRCICSGAASAIGYHTIHKDEPSSYPEPTKRVAFSNFFERNFSSNAWSDLYLFPDLSNRVSFQRYLNGRFFYLKTPPDSSPSYRVPEVVTYKIADQREIGKITTLFLSCVYMGAAAIYRGLCQKKYIQFVLLFPFPSIGSMVIKNRIEKLHSYQLLTGNSIPLDGVSPSSSQSKANLDLAIKILDYLKGISSYNFIQRNHNVYQLSDCEYEDLFKSKYLDFDQIISREVSFTDRILGWSRFREESIRMFRDKQVGNCRIISDIGLLWLKEKPQNNPDSILVERFGLANGDHVLLLVGRDPSEQGTAQLRDAVICDPWAQACYPVSMVFSCLYDYKGHIPIDRRFQTVVELVRSDQDLVSIGS